MTALIVGGDPEMVSIFSRLFREKRIQTQVCLHESDAIHLLALEKFAAIVMDSEDFGGYANALKRLAGPNTRVPVFAVGTGDNLKLAAHLGAGLLVERFWIPLEIREQLRAAYGRMLRNEQRYFKICG